MLATSSAGRTPSSAGPTPSSAGRCPEPGRPPLPQAELADPGPPWSLRLAAATIGQPAVEIYASGSLVDVVVATPVAPQLLRGARRARWNGVPRVIAWGRLPADGAPLAVTFARGRVHPAAVAAEVTEAASWCWLASVEGAFSQVIVTNTRTGERRVLRIGGVPRWLAS
jgi:hypothetical protein